MWSCRSIIAKLWVGFPGDLASLSSFRPTDSREGTGLPSTSSVASLHLTPYDGFSSNLLRSPQCPVTAPGRRRHLRVFSPTLNTATATHSERTKSKFTCMPVSARSCWVHCRCKPIVGSSSQEWVAFERCSKPIHRWLVVRLLSRCVAAPAALRIPPSLETKGVDRTRNFPNPVSVKGTRFRPDHFELV